jgi:hypothetical protein
MTGHFIGGCVIGETADDGVADPHHRMHGHPGLHVIDRSTFTADLGLDPSFTNTALAERATAPCGRTTASRTSVRHWARPTSGSNRSASRSYVRSSAPGLRHDVRPAVYHSSGSPVRAEWIAGTSP